MLNIYRHWASGAFLQYRQLRPLLTGFWTIQNPVWIVHTWWTIWWCHTKYLWHENFVWHQNFDDIHQNLYSVIQILMMVSYKIPCQAEYLSANLISILLIDRFLSSFTFPLTFDIPGIYLYLYIYAYFFRKCMHIYILFPKMNPNIFKFNFSRNFPNISSEEINHRD